MVQGIRGLRGLGARGLAFWDFGIYTISCGSEKRSNQFLILIYDSGLYLAA